MPPTLKNLFFPPPPLALAVIFVEYSRQKHGGSGQAFAQLQQYLAPITGTELTYLRVDNRAEGLPLRQEEVNLFRVGGDNRFQEFSGWQKGVETIAKFKTAFDLVLFVNDMFLKPGPSFLQDYATQATLRRILEKNIVLGRIDSTGRLYSACGHELSRWICTNCFLLPWKAMTRIGSLVTVGDNLSDFLPSSYPRDHRLGQYPLSFAATGAGHFTITLPLAGTEPLELRLYASQSHPRPHPLQFGETEVEASFILDSMELNDQRLGGENIVYGRHPGGGEAWIRQNTLFQLPAQTGAPRKLTLRGTIPPGICHDQYRDRLELTWYNDSLLFHPQAPLNHEYKRWLVEWLTTRWHSRFQIGPESWELFRTKVRNILNEALLTARLTEAGYPPESYGEKWYY